MKNIIVCFFGVIPRSIKFTKKCIYGRILNPLCKNFKVEIYIFNIDVKDEKVDGRRINRTDIVKLNFDFLEQKCQADIDEIIKDKLKPMSYGGNENKSTINSYRTMYSELMVGEFLEKNSEKYDLAIISSSDFFFHNTISIEKINECFDEDNVVYTTNVHDSQDGYTDGFYVGKPKNIIKIMSRYREIEKYHLLETDNYERILKRSFILNDIERKIFPISFCKIRANRDVWGPKKIDIKDKFKPF